MYFNLSCTSLSLALYHTYGEGGIAVGGPPKNCGKIAEIAEIAEKLWTAIPPFTFGSVQSFKLGLKTERRHTLYS